MHTSIGSQLTSEQPVASAGAAAAGVDSALVAGGIHADDLQIYSAKDELDMDQLRDWLAAYSSKPTFVMPFLQP